jgi:hypothetical protein
MKIDDVIAALQKIPGNPEVEIANVMISVDEDAMPSFDIVSVEALSELVDIPDDEEDNEKTDEVIFIMCSDHTYLADEYVRKDLLDDEEATEEPKTGV